MQVALLGGESRMNLKDLGGVPKRGGDSMLGHRGPDLWRQTNGGGGDNIRRRRGRNNLAWQAQIYLSQQRHRSPHPGQPMQMLDI